MAFVECENLRPIRDNLGKFECDPVEELREELVADRPRAMTRASAWSDSIDDALDDPGTVALIAAQRLID